MTKITHLLLLLLAVCLWTSCRNNGNEQHEPSSKSESAPQDIRLAPGFYTMDEPDNLTAYFETLCREHGAVVAVHSDNPLDSIKIWQTIRLLDEYADGNRKYYPSDEVRQSLDALALDLGYWFNHGDVEDTNFAEVFFFRFLEQVVRLSPQVDFVSDFHCNDGSAGILNFHEWSPNPLYSFLVYPSNGGLRVRMVGDVGDTKIMKLFHLSDDAGRDYYLCSNNGDLEEGDGIYRVAFRQFLFLRDGDNLSEVASYSNSDFIPDGFDGKVVFNPQSLRWDCCKMDGDKYVPVANSKSLHLNLDGKNSRIIVR